MLKAIAVEVLLYDAYQFGCQNPVSRGALEIVARSVALEDLRAQGQKFQAEVRTAARRDFREPFGDDFEKRVVAREAQAVVQDGPREFEGFIDGMPVRRPREKVAAASSLRRRIKSLSESNSGWRRRRKARSAASKQEGAS